MDFSLSAEQQAVRDAARQILQRRSADRTDFAAPAGDDAWFDRELWRDLAAADLLGLAVDESEGGVGFGLVEIVVLLEEAGRALSRVPLLPTALLGALAIGALGTREQRSKWLSRVTTGAAVLSAALVESDVRAPHEVSTNAERTASGRWGLTGTKVAVPYAREADRIVVPARAGGAIRLFLLDPSADGVELVTELTTDGSPQYSLTMTNALVPEADVLSGEAESLDGYRWLLDRATVGYCAYQLGIAEASLAMTATYTGSRHQFGRPIGSFQAVAMQAANCYIDVLAMRVTLVQAAWLLAEGRPADRELAIAKFWAAEAGQRVSATAQHLHGGIGIDMDYPLHRYLLSSKQTELTLGSASWHLGRLTEILDQKQP